MARFEREARALAALNHPNIATIHGREVGDSGLALVMELVEGPTLAERLAHNTRRDGSAAYRSPSVTIARQIAEALDAAHDKGIVHRDLKPANIKITPDGVVKVLDFGLAKLTSRAEDSDAHAGFAHHDRLRAREGLVVGTAGYMSPEQARGQFVDKRTDIWAFGCVLYEMLAGRPAFAR